MIASVGDGFDEMAKELGAYTINRRIFFQDRVLLPIFTRSFTMLIPNPGGHC